MFEVKIKDKYRKGIKVGLMPFGFIIPEYIFQESYTAEYILKLWGTQGVSAAFFNINFFITIIVYLYLFLSLYLLGVFIYRFFNINLRNEKNGIHSYIEQVEEVDKKLDGLPSSLKVYFENILYATLAGTGKIDSQLCKTFHRTDGLGIKGKIDNILNKGIHVDQEAYTWLIETVLEKNIKSKYYGIWDVDIFKPMKYYENHSETFLMINKHLIDIHKIESNIRIFITNNDINEEFINKFIEENESFINKIIIKQWKLKKVFFIKKPQDNISNVWMLHDGLIVSNGEKFIIRFNEAEKILTFDMDRVEQYIDSLETRMNLLENEYIYENEEDKLTIKYA